MAGGRRAAAAAALASAACLAVSASAAPTLVELGLPRQGPDAAATPEDHAREARARQLAMGSREAARPMREQLEGALAAAFPSGVADEGARRALDEAEPAPMRLMLSFQLDDAPLSADHKAFLTDTVGPLLRDIVADMLKVRKPVAEGQALKIPGTCEAVWSFGKGLPTPCGRVTAPSQATCGYAVHDPRYLGETEVCDCSVAFTPDDCACAPAYEAGEGAADADFIMYVTAYEWGPCIGTSNFAFASSCVSDYDVMYGSANRPLSGNINFCPSMMATSASDAMAMRPSPAPGAAPTTNLVASQLLDFGVHEALHALFFSPLLFGEFVDPATNEQLPLSAIVSQDEYGQQAIVSPRVVSEARDYFDCDTMTGMPLEDAGGESSEDSHWDQVVLYDEIMSSTGLVGINSWISRMTLALAEDSGWYLPDYSMAGASPYGYARGCPLAMHHPMKEAGGANCPAMDGLCAPAAGAQLGCSYDSRFQAGCAEIPNSACGVMLGYVNKDCTNPDHLWNPSTETAFGETFGLNSRCLPKAGEWVRDDGYYVEAEAGCYSSMCEVDDATGETRFMVGINGKYLHCPSGGYVDASAFGGFIEGQLGPCPDNEQVCSFHGCGNDCSGRGACMRGVCRCFLGAAGPDCSRDRCMPGDTQCEAELSALMTEAARGEGEGGGEGELSDGGSETVSEADNGGGDKEGATEGGNKKKAKKRSKKKKTTKSKKKKSKLKLSAQQVKKLCRKAKNKKKCKKGDAKKHCVYNKQKSKCTPK